ncbi:hypothetical protein [uncultured Campylobacter sp.]|uniref:hypothetical protein n=1 Tax=uncultured Campylobacter sp. TaxID=218934 RepID=UPI0026283BAD|nr:hypothetical protein [uncultured Campylobacter sp.]
MQIFINSLPTVSVVFEFLAIFLAFYFKQSRILFLALFLLLFRSLYLFAPLTEVNFLMSMFLPFIWFLLCILPSKDLLFSKLNLSALTLFVVMFVLMLLCLKNDYLAHTFKMFILEQNFTFAEFSFVPFFAIFIFLVLLSLFKRENSYQVLSFVLAYIVFFTQYSKELFYFEFASLFFVFYIFYNNYKSLFFDSISSLPNENSLKRFIRARENLSFALLSFEFLDEIQDRYSNLYIRKIAKILRYLSKDYKIFSTKIGFVFVFEKEENLKSLDDIAQRLRNTQIKIGKERLALPINTKILDEKELKNILI